MRRRHAIKLLGGLAVSWPFAAQAQQPAMPVIGLLSPRGASDAPELMAAFRQGLKDTGFVEGQNVGIEYRYQNERLPALAADLIHRQVTMIAATAIPAALAAKAVTTTIPIVFETGVDPIQFGLVTSLNRPGGNVTGVTQTNAEIAPKRLELLHEQVPAATVMALLVNPANAILAETQSSEVQSAANTLGLELHILNASTERDFDAVFAKLVELRTGGLVIAGDPFFTARQEQLAALALRHGVPAVYQGREFAVAGGLMSYGGSTNEAYRLTGVYTARILQGEKPSELPVQQSTKVELFLNLKTAKAFGITFPLTLLGRADEVIE